MKRTVFLGMTLLLVALIATACTMKQFPFLSAGSGVASAPERTATQAPVAVASALATEPPTFSALVTPTPLPTLAGPMGTLTAIADLVASPTQDTEPYTIVNRGNPHFIEFHAWW